MGQPSQLCSELCFLPPRAAGFAVVKKGKDKKTGAPVAIKVRVVPCLALPCLCHRMRLMRSPPF